MNAAVNQSQYRRPADPDTIDLTLPGRNRDAVVGDQHPVGLGENGSIGTRCEYCGAMSDVAEDVGLETGDERLDVGLDAPVDQIEVFVECAPDAGNDDFGFLVDVDAIVGEDLAQVRLGPGSPAAASAADDGCRLVIQRRGRVAGQPVDGVLERSRHRPVVLRTSEQHRIDVRQLPAHPLHRFRQADGLEVAVVERQVGDRGHLERHRVRHGIPNGT